MDPKAFQNSPTGRAVHVIKGDYWAYVPNPLPPSLIWTSELVADLSTADQALGRLASEIAQILQAPDLGGQVTEPFPVGIPAERPLIGTGLTVIRLIACAM